MTKSIVRRKAKRSSRKPASASGDSKKKKHATRGIHLSRMGRRELWESTYELRRFRALDASPDVRAWTRSHGIRISYRLKGKRHRYSPDILVTMNDGTTFLEEVKGYVRDSVVFQYKNFAALHYCKRKGWKFRIVFLKDLEVV